MSYYKNLLIILCLLIVQLPSAALMKRFNIDAQRNAVDHNNRGVIYMQDRYYAPAIKEFQMAVMLDSDTQASAVYYANLANCYMKIGYPALAQDTLQRAMLLNPMNFPYYEDLVMTYKKLGILGQKLKYYQKDSAKNPLSHIMVGLILIAQGKTDSGLSKLQEFVYTEPALIITNGVKAYVEKRSKEKF